MCAADSTPALLECPESCHSETDTFEECSCRVESLVTGSTSWRNVYTCVLGASARRYFDAAFPEEFLRELTHMVSTASVQEGEMVESASTADPIFWFIHPTIERLLAAKRLPGVTHIGDQEFSKWQVVDGSEESFLEYSYYNFKAGAKSFHPDAYTCYGHAAVDKVLPSRLPMTDVFVAAADTNKDGIINNQEFYTALNPNDPDLNDYVFADFTWDHCQ
jgi:hypothetical protein